ncbi:flagellar assembly protein FliW [Paenibacillus sp. F411]|uniref:flagellar assembly protein FliW n=1 Tax=Paenibacillus sp. F411 TaxID=2820239 RepID=UPI001AAE25F9|nr:flagellar assembly protein FliW [Paenibacillus sp. F411]
MIKNINGMTLNLQGSILGFSELNEYKLETIDQTVFVHLRSLEKPEISFIVTSPFDWYKDYLLNLDDHLKDKLKIENPEDTLILCIVTIREPLNASTINLAAPLIINIKEQAGLQQVIQQTIYRPNNLLFDNLGSEGEAVE